MVQRRHPKSHGAKMNFALTCVGQQIISQWDSFLLEFPQHFCWAASLWGVSYLLSCLPAPDHTRVRAARVWNSQISCKQSPPSPLELPIWKRGLPGLPIWSEVSIFWVLCATLGTDPCCGVPINPLEIQVPNEENVFFWKFSLAYQSKTPHGVCFRGCFYFPVHHMLGAG